MFGFWRSINTLDKIVTQLNAGQALYRYESTWWFLRFLEWLRGEGEARVWIGVGGRRDSISPTKAQKLKNPQEGTNYNLIAPSLFGPFLQYHWNWRWVLCRTLYRYILATILYYIPVILACRVGLAGLTKPLSFHSYHLLSDIYIFVYIYLMMLKSAKFITKK